MNTYKTDLLDLRQMDCMDLLRDTPDKTYDLCICDPPYGIGIDGQKESKNGKKSDRKEHITKGWDSNPPPAEYFAEIHRVSKNCIVWGANYMIHGLHESHKGWIVWDKGQHGLTMSDCEIAYSTFDVPTRIWTQNRVALLQEGTIHPTQKPIKLYNYLLHNYAKPGDKILDTHLGSMSIAIACHYKGFQLTGCELDEDYYKAGVERVKRETAQLELL